MIGVDWGYGDVDPQDIKAQGFQFVCRYLSNSPGKNLTQDELSDLRSAGLKVVVVWETTEQRSLDGHDAGVEDANRAVQELTAMGVSDVPIYFACDYDFSENDQDAITDYFKGVNSVIGKDRTGVYGGLGVVGRTLDAGVANYAWQTSAWSRGKWDGRENIRQIEYNTMISGVQCDKNVSITNNFGQF